jgi:hypothetical protein
MIAVSQGFAGSWAENDGGVLILGVYCCVILGCDALFRLYKRFGDGNCAHVQGVVKTVSLLRTPKSENQQPFERHNLHLI